MHARENAFSHRGENCPGNTWERTNQSSGRGCCKISPMTSQCSYWRDVAIHSGVMTLCSEQQNYIKIGLFIANKGVGEKKSITSFRKGPGNPILVSMICDIHDSASLVVDCKSWTLGWDFPCHFRSVVIDSNSPALHEINTLLKNHIAPPMLSQC